MFWSCVRALHNWYLWYIEWATPYHAISCSCTRKLFIHQSCPRARLSDFFLLHRTKCKPMHYKLVMVHQFHPSFRLTFKQSSCRFLLGYHYRSTSGGESCTLRYSRKKSTYPPSVIQWSCLHSIILSTRCLLLLFSIDSISQNSMLEIKPKHG